MSELCSSSSLNPAFRISVNCTEHRCSANKGRKLRQSKHKRYDLAIIIKRNVMYLFRIRAIFVTPATTGILQKRDERAVHAIHRCEMINPILPFCKHACYEIVQNRHICTGTGQSRLRFCNQLALKIGVWLELCTALIDNNRIFYLVFIGSRCQTCPL